MTGSVFAQPVIRVGAILVLLFAVVCYGWGRLCGRFCYGPGTTSPGLDIALGLAALGVLGGVLNVLHLSTPGGLYLLGAVGISLAGFFISKEARAQCPDNSGVARRLIRRTDWLPYGAVLVLALAQSHLVMPSAAFNLADDFQSYMVRPVRMLATGSGAGNPFDGLGMDGCGTQSFFQSFFILWTPVTYLNGFDAVFCFGLCALLLVDVARKLDLGWGISILAVLVFGAINPQIVNISSVYSGSVMILGLLIAGWKLMEQTQAHASPSWKHALPVGLFAGCLVTFKPTLAMFAASHFILFFLGVAVWRSRKTALIMAAATGLATFLSALPWLLVVAKTYSNGDWPAGEASAFPLASKHGSLVARDLPALLSTKELFYGGSQLAYNVLAILVGLSGLFAVYFLARRPAPMDGPLLASFAPVVVLALPLYLLNAHLFPITWAIRYSCPILIATAPVAGLVTYRIYANRMQVEAAATPSSARTNLRRLLPLAAQWLIVAMFFSAFYERVYRAWRARTLVSFPIDQRFIDYSQHALSKPVADWLRGLQAQIPAGETILAWTATPFHLDYQRNRVLSVAEPGPMNPLLRFPAGADESTFHRFLQSQGVRYVLFQGQGYGMQTTNTLDRWRHAKYTVHRKLADYNIYGKNALLALADKSRVLYRDDELVLFDLGGPKTVLTQDLSDGR